MNVFEILEDMSAACPVKCECAITSSVPGEIELRWRFGDLSYSRTITEREYVQSWIDVIEVNILEAKEYLREAINESTNKKD